MATAMVWWFLALLIFFSAVPSFAITLPRGANILLNGLPPATFHANFGRSLPQTIMIAISTTQRESFSFNVTMVDDVWSQGAITVRGADGSLSRVVPPKVHFTAQILGGYVSATVFDDAISLVVYKSGFAFEVRPKSLVLNVLSDELKMALASFNQVDGIFITQSTSIKFSLHKTGRF